jgi:hypothetical protein
MSMMNAFFVEKDDKIYLIGYVSGNGAAIEPHKLPLGIANAAYGNDYVRQVQKTMRGTYGGKNCRGTFKSREWSTYAARTRDSSRPEGPRWQYTLKKDGHVYVSYLGGNFVRVSEVAPVTNAIEVVDEAKSKLWYAQHPIDKVTEKEELGTKLYKKADETRSKLVERRNKLFGLKAK